MKLELTDREIAIAQGQDPDATIVVPDTEVENGRGTEAAQTNDEQAAETEQPAQPAWYDADLEQKAQANYGLTKADLDEFKDRETFERTTRHLDRLLLNSGRQPETAGKPEPTERQDQKPPETVKDDSTPAALERFDIEALRKAGYDEDTLKLFERQNKQINFFEQQTSRLATVEQHYQQQLHQAHIAEFHRAADALDEELFGRQYKDGKPVPLAKETDGRRKQLYDTAMTLVAGMYTRAQASGQAPQIPPMEALLERAAELEFGKELRARAEAKRTAEIASQSKRRRPAPGRPVSTQPTQGAEKDPIKAIANDPKVMKMWASFQEANGVAS